MGGIQKRKRLPRGIGEQVFAEVESLTAQGKMTKSAAFEEIAKRTGGQAGTIAANYYRIARKRGVPLRPRRGARLSGGIGKRSAATIAAAIQKLQAVLQVQEQELAVLRKENQQLEKLRRLLRA